MPYTCKSCGRYQLGQSADGICPASECQPARQAAEVKKPYSSPTLLEVDGRLIDEMKREERAAIVAWIRRLQAPPVYRADLIERLADAIEAGEHVAFSLATHPRT